MVGVEPRSRLLALRDARHLRGTRVLYQEHGEPLTEKVVQTLLLRAAKRAGVLNNWPHVLPHTFCSHLAMRGAPAIQELAGHQDLTTTQLYMHLSPATLEHAIQLLEGPASAQKFGDVGETGDRQIANVNG
jgi:site-specific recombinase XerD